ncbi:RING/FYVE/PHD zinc finger superfamily protein isoform 1 [Tripterygium wilfordii]|uniref:RING/FYVE/PHD zinc finger superfamily protein isoform 1 n=1 Tax=Tripterygium wilfordii TaxID=458696 RepID=A0A7J7DFI6_TRIWF|nr:PHD finger protein At1g33420-like [Tripterygium wilfordii]KAF5745071.1 RING/FYVE/PHD zinc finger superfamily protein isoform 1 [Tripterygium wilfordii]
MVVNGRPLKRMKRRVTADLHDFLTFPSSATGGNGPFRVNVREFLTEHALLPPPSSLLPHLLTWQISFRVGEPTDEPDSASPVVCVDVVEEDVAKSRSVYCDQCRVVGWSGNPVCSKRYHFIIKADGASIGGYHKPCTRCGDILHLSESRCKMCNHVTTTDDVEDWIYQQLEDTTHLLHGVIHVNGYGHLLRVNGREGGSRILSGCHIMNFWDRLCKALGVRKVSVMDVSKKYGLEYRLLHAITKGHPWYGDWGYEFGSGSFALTLDAYKSAVETLSGMPLSVFLSQGRQQPTWLQDRISFYQSLSERRVVNIRELFSYLMSLIHIAHKSSSGVNTTFFKRQGSSGISRTWDKSDIERVNEAIFRVLRAVSGSKWASSRALRGAVCRIGSPDLLDHCLKELGGKSAANAMVVHTRQNPVSGALEFRLEPGSPPEVITCGSDSSVIKSPCPSLEVLMQDLQFFYETIHHPQTILSCSPEATRDLVICSAEKLLDCKQFVKEYKPEKQASLNPSIICLSCQMELSDESDKFAPNPPPELIILPLTASVADLKHEASRAFQDVYLMFKRFEAEELLGYGGVDDSIQVKLLLGSTESVCVRGRCAGKTGLSKYRMERGTERWTVDCICGAKDDDGERMLACDVCGVWQHTRCSGIQDSYSVPARFVCHRCRGSDHVNKVNGQCKDEKMTDAVGGNSSSFGKSLTADDVR